MRRRETFSPAVLEGILFDELGLPRTTAFAVAFSGGADSSALLHALAGMPRDQAPVRAIHIDHGLHAEAHRWAEHCERTSAALGIPCVTGRIEAAALPRLGREGSARAARYEALRTMLADSEVLLTAHHEDDQAETVLLQLLRGSGISGLAAIPHSQPFGRGWLVRPLLGVPRAELRRYAERHGLSWVEDPSNSDCELRRNHLRHRVLPLLEERWPRSSAALARAARRARDAQKVLAEVAGADLARALDPARGALQVRVLRDLSPERLANLLHFWITQAGAACSESQIRRLGAWILGEAGSSRISWAGIDIRRYRGLVYRLASCPSTGFAPLTWDLRAPLALPALGLTLIPVPRTGDGLACERVPEVEVRLRRGGEVCRPRAAKHHRRLKKMLQDGAVPPWERERLPLLFAAGELAAVADLWVCEPFAARANEPGVVVRVRRHPDGRYSD
ncbi:MAG: tRNA lysidine(34) synthetase TilS [Acidiferrobacteraceae bacterium]